MTDRATHLQKARTDGQTFRLEAMMICLLFSIGHH